MLACRLAREGRRTDASGRASDRAHAAVAGCARRRGRTMPRRRGRPDRADREPPRWPPTTRAPNRSRNAARRCLRAGQRRKRYGGAGPQPTPACASRAAPRPPRRSRHASTRSRGLSKAARATSAKVRTRPPRPRELNIRIAGGVGRVIIPTAMEGHRCHVWRGSRRGRRLPRFGYGTPGAIFAKQVGQTLCVIGTPMPMAATSPSCSSQESLTARRPHHAQTATRRSSGPPGPLGDCSRRRMAPLSLPHVSCGRHDRQSAASATRGAQTERLGRSRRTAAIARAQAGSRAARAAGRAMPARRAPCLEEARSPTRERRRAEVTIIEADALLRHR